jgi:hypothetical protein
MKPNKGFNTKKGKETAIVALPIICTILESNPDNLNTHKSKTVTTIVAIREINATLFGFLKKPFIQYSLFIDIYLLT